MRLDASSRVHVINSNSSLASPSSISLFAETTNPRNGEAEIIRSRDKFIPTGKTGNKLVDKQSSPSEWKISNIKPSTVDNKFRCFQRRMGSSLSKSTCWGALDNNGETVTHKCLGIKGSNVSHQDIHSFKRSNNIDPYSNGQHDCPVLLGEDGRDTKSRINQGQQGDMGLFVGQTDHDYGRISPGLLERRSRLGISKCEGLQRMEIKFPDISADLQITRDPGDRPFCLTSITSTSNLQGMEGRPIQLGLGCFPNKLVSEVQLCFPSLLIDRQGVEESPSKPSLYDPNNSSVANSAMVSLCVANGSTKSCVVASTKESSNKSVRGVSPTCSEQIPAMETEGISQRAVSLTTNSRRTGSNSNYESAWRKWASWCAERKADPTRCNVNYILDILAESFENGLEYSTISGYRSAISAYHTTCEGFKVGKHPRVSGLMTSIFNKRSPLPKYNFIWDVEEVLNYIKSL